MVDELHPCDSQSRKVPSRASLTWWTALQVAAILRVTRGHVHVLAHRDGWRRLGSGRTVRYLADDVDDTRERRAA